MEISKNNIEDLKTGLLQAMDDQRRIDRDLHRQDMRAIVQEMKDEILSGVSDIVGNGILPQLDDHDERLKGHEHRIMSLEEKMNA